MSHEPEQPADEPEDLAQRLRRWRKAHPKATFTEMEAAIDAELSRLRQAMLGEMAAEGQREEAPVCPECGERLVRNGRKKRGVRTKDNQVVRLEREQWRCLRCGATLFPPG